MARWVVVVVVVSAVRPYSGGIYNYTGSEGGAAEMVVTEVKAAVMVAVAVWRGGPRHRTPEVLRKHEQREASPGRHQSTRLGREGNLVGPLYDLWYVYARSLRVLASRGPLPLRRLCEVITPPPSRNCKNLV